MTITKTFTEGTDSFVVNTNDSYVLDFAGGNDILRVQAGTTTAHMGSGNDFVRVDGGSAAIFGDAGLDRFDLYGGAVTANGGADSDRFNIRGGSNHVLDGGAGDDAFVFYSGATGEQLSGGDGNDRFYGNDMSVGGQLNGGAGNDAFYDFGMQARLAGGAGNDVYRVVSASGPTILENAGEGIDTVQVARGISYTLGANVENLRVLDSGSGGETLTGNSLGNHIVGSSGADTIIGMDGNDNLSGGAGDDSINGGAGNDRITGGLGMDQLFGGSGADVFAYTSLADISLVYGAEFIADYDAEDRIDLSAIDANTSLSGNQAFVFAGYSFGSPPDVATQGTLTIGGFGGDLWIQAYIDDQPGADLLINLWSATGEGALTVDNVIL